MEKINPLKNKLIPVVDFFSTDLWNWNKSLVQSDMFCQIFAFNPIYNYKIGKKIYYLFLCVGGEGIIYFFNFKEENSLNIGFKLSRL